MATAFRKPGVRMLTGIEELDKKLAELKIGAANKIARPALNKAATLLLKRMKSAVPPKYKEAKRGLGKAVDAKGGRNRNEVRAKVGSNVGIKAERKAKINKKLTSKRVKAKKKTGVGIGPNNLHWFILGTTDRVQKKTGKTTGTMRPLMPGLVKNATNSAKSEITAIIKTEVTTRLAELAKK